MKHLLSQDIERLLLAVSWAMPIANIHKLSVVQVSISSNAFTLKIEEF